MKSESIPLMCDTYIDYYARQYTQSLVMYTMHDQAPLPTVISKGLISNFRIASLRQNQSILVPSDTKYVPLWHCHKGPPRICCQNRKTPGPINGGQTLDTVQVKDYM